MNRAEKLEHIKGKYAVIVAIISFTGLIISSIISIFSIDLNKTLTQENTKLFEENNDWEIAYNELHEDFNELNNKNNSLSRDMATLKNSIEQYSTLVTENESLKNEVSELKNEIRSLDDSRAVENDEKENQESNIISDNINNKVSIFDLDTFKGDPFWFDATYTRFTDVYFIGTYGGKHDGAHLGGHGATNKNDDHPIYLLDREYNLCEGEIAWSKYAKDFECSPWIEFYSIANDGSIENLLYSTDPITANSRPLQFSFSVENVEKMKLVRNGSNSHGAYIIYDYLDLIK